MVHLFPSYLDFNACIPVQENTVLGMDIKIKLSKTILIDHVKFLKNLSLMTRIFVELFDLKYYIYIKALQYKIIFY